MFNILSAINFLFVSSFCYITLCTLTRIYYHCSGATVVGRLLGENCCWLMARHYILYKAHPNENIHLASYK